MMKRDKYIFKKLVKLIIANSISRSLNIAMCSAINPNAADQIAIRHPIPLRKFWNIGR